MTLGEDWVHSFPYFLDIANSTVMNTPVAFAARYPELGHYSQILTHQKSMEGLLYRMIATENKGDDLDIPALIKESGFDDESCDSITQVLKAKYSEYKRELIRKEVSLGGWHYLGTNWKVKNVVGCSEFTHKSRVLVKVDIDIGKGKWEDHVDIISLELGVTELRELLNTLKHISKQLKNSAV